MELPYMKFWTQRFFGSVRVQALRGEHRLIYLGLLVAEWGLDGRGLPNDLAEMGRILGISEDALREAWGDGTNRVSQFFRLCDGRLFNETLETTLLDDKRERRALVVRAKKGANTRWDKKRQHARALLKQCPAEDGDGDGDVSKDGDEGANGAEPSVLERLCDEFHFGTPKAQEIFRRWGYTHEDLNAWLQFEGGRGNGTRLRNHLMKSAKNPDDVKPFEGGKPRDLGRTSSLNDPNKFNDPKYH